jgi:hypothetical protein
VHHAEGGRKHSRVDGARTFAHNILTNATEWGLASVDLLPAADERVRIRATLLLGRGESFGAMFYCPTPFESHDSRSIEQDANEERIAFRGFQKVTTLSHPFDDTPL